MARKGGKKITCFNCQKPRHIITECPDIKNKPSFSNKPKKPFKKKVPKATWDSESKSKEEVDTANVCFMANDNTPKVTFESSLDDYDLTIDELGDAFVELSNNYDFLKKKYLKTKKKNEVLQNKIITLFKEKDDLSSILFVNSKRL